MKTLSKVHGAIALVLLAAFAPARADGVLQLRIDGPKVRLSYAVPLEEMPDFGIDRFRVRLGGLRVYETRLDGNARTALGNWSMMGDYYFDRQGGFRASGGLLAGERLGDHAGLAALGAPGSGLGLTGLRTPMTLDLHTRPLPYIGMGYTEPSWRGSNWSFFADVGMVMLKPRSTVKLGAAAGGAWLNGDEGRRVGEMDLPGPLGDWRLSPVIQFGLSYAF